MPNLKEDYKDDILDISQNVRRKYQMIDNGDGTVSFEDVTEYTQQGDSFGASDLNDMAHAINNVSSDAEHTSYDNTTSGLISDNVQGAIDENVANMKWYVDNGWLPVRPSGDVPANMEDCSWAMLKQLAAADTLKDYYSVGDTKTIELTGGERVVMVLASINDGSGSAGGYYPRGTCDFISQDCLADANPTFGTQSGYTESTVRSYLNSNVLASLPQQVRDAIVKKTHKTYDLKGQALKEWSDDIWLMTEWEVSGAVTTATQENGNLNKWYPIFPDANSRRKKAGTAGSWTNYWTATPYVDYNNICIIKTDGSKNYGSYNGTQRVPLCFRIGQLFT